MPTLQLSVSPPQGDARCQLLAAALTSITAELLGKRSEVTAVLIDERPAARWFIGGETATRPTALLAIDITAGTNSAAEKAAFVQAAFATLQQLIGDGAPLHEAGYVIVRELPAGDWGYGGQTQAARRLQREAAPSAAQTK